MEYDLLNGDTYEEVNNDFFTIGDLLEVAEQHPDKVFKFLGVPFYPQEIISWRGSYGIPAILYSKTPITGKELEESLKSGLDEVHYGYKGGEYKYYEIDEFYLTWRSSEAEEYKVVDSIISERDNTVTLMTKLAPY